ncbi:hypothetical protein V8D89_000345 [Ganoderma adspersum]
MSSSAAARFLFSSPAGFRLVREILSKHIPYQPHDWQLEGVCKMLDGKDLVAILPTGAGKTGYFTMFMLTLVELSQDPSLCSPPVSVPRDPCMIVVYPTNGLEEEQARVFMGVGLKTLVINAETTSTACLSGEDLWLTARVGVTMILLSPEQLSTRGFESLIRHRPFQARFQAFGVDEIHLLNSWGLAFHQAFRQLGHARARLSSHVFVGTSATVLAGDVRGSIFAFLGLHPGTFYLIQRSNLRQNVQTIFRTLTHGIGGWSFSDLKWVVESKRKTVIHCRTITLGFRLALYLWRLIPSHTRQLMRDDPETQIVIATAAFMVGIDLPNIRDVILLGALESADEHVQWEGRAGRDGSIVSDARCITYVTSKSLEVTHALCAGKQPAASHGTKKTGGKAANILYNNPPNDPPCSCSTCTPPGAAHSHLLELLSMEPSPVLTCNCSRCVPEPSGPVKVKTRAPDTNPIPRSKRLTRKMRAKGTKELVSLRMTMYLSTDISISRSLPPEVFLPDTTIKLILDRFALIDTRAALQELMKGWNLLTPHIDVLWDMLVGLQTTFEAMRARSKAKAKAREAERRARRKVEAAEASESLEAGGDSEVEARWSRIWYKAGLGPGV